MTEEIMTSNWSATNIPALTDKIAIITGANSGIGFEIARALASKNATVILACRNKEKGETAVQQIGHDSPKAKPQFMQLDLADLASIHSFAEAFTGQYDQLDILINNAGIMWAPFRKTADGFESQFGTNHLGHFALTGLLLDTIMHTPQARVVTVSSWGERYGKIDFDNLNAEKSYDSEQAYGQSKLANILFTYELQRRFEKADINAIAAAAHPGATDTNLPTSWAADNPRPHWRVIRILNSFIGQKPEMGALPALYAATASDVQGGDYYGPRSLGGIRGYPTKIQSSERSYNTDIATRLWAVSEELTGVQYHFKHIGS
jgi:NAD(P)-dependent dehydrogenase (short-subunit alcohol dehydrogenase family)